MSATHELNLRHLLRMHYLGASWNIDELIFKCVCLRAVRCRYNKRFCLMLMLKSF